ncbi:hypothetical protein DT87_31090 [Streptomyces sp. NTK 937]|nr:hypothetical protein DT87_31090 [Streptomyces sp. NTK 937]
MLGRSVRLRSFGGAIHEPCPGFTVQRHLLSVCIPHAHARGIHRVRPLVLQHHDVGHRRLARIRGSLHDTEDVVPELPVGSVLLLDLRAYLLQGGGDLSTPLLRELLPELLLTLVLICPAQTDERFRKSKRPRAWRLNC